MYVAGNDRIRPNKACSDHEDQVCHPEYLMYYEDDNSPGMDIPTVL